MLHCGFAVQACVLQDLLARPQLSKTSKSTRTCIIPASKGRLVFVLKYHAHATVPQIDTSSLQLTGMVPVVSSAPVFCSSVRSGASCLRGRMPRAWLQYGRAVCTGFGPVTSTAGFSYNRATGLLTVTFSPASVAHRCAQHICLRELAHGEAVRCPLSPGLLRCAGQPHHGADADVQTFVCNGRRSANFLRGHGLKLVGISKSRDNGRPICIVAHPQICA